jgi:hypothetical protein
MNLVTAEMCADRVYRAEAENDRSIGPDVQRLKDLELDLTTSRELWGAGEDGANDRADILRLAVEAAERLALVGHPAGRMAASLARMV